MTREERDLREAVKAHLRKLQYMRWKEALPYRLDAMVARGPKEGRPQYWRAGDPYARTFGVAS